MERDGDIVMNVPRELLRRRVLLKVSPNPPPRAAVCDMRELMRLIARWAFSRDGIEIDELVTFHDLPLTSYNKNGRAKCGGEKRRQYAELAYNDLIQKFAFFDVVDVRAVTHTNKNAQLQTTTPYHTTYSHHLRSCELWELSFNMPVQHASG